MATTFAALPAPAGNGSGVAVDVSTFGAKKTIVVEGNGSVLYEPYVLVEVSNDALAANWSPLTMFLRPGEKTIAVACRWMRATVKNYRQGGAPTVNVGGQDDGTTFATLVAPASNGNGAGVDVSALPGFKTVQVSGAFKGSLNIEVSNDGGATYSLATAFQPNHGGITSSVIIGQFMRINRSGISSGDPSPGLPVISIAASESAGGGGGGGAVSAQELTITPALTVAPAAGTINDYNPAGFSDFTHILVDTTAGSVAFTGFAAQGDGDVRIVTNIGPSDLTLLNEDIGSAAANRFAALPAPGVLIAVNSSAILMWDSTVNRWIVLAAPWGGVVVSDYVITQKLRLSGTITPAPLAAGATNDYALTAPSSTSRYLIGSNVAGSTLTGMVAQNNGDLVFITNTGPGLLTFTDQDAGSAAANQFMLPGALPLVLQDEASVLFVYDSGVSKWRPYSAVGLSRIDANVVNVATTFHGDGLNRLYQTVIQGYFALNSVITPAALGAGTTQDYDLNPGLVGANRIRQATDAANSALGGMVGIGVNGAEYTLINLGPGTLTLNNNDAGSAAGNKFFTEGGVNRVIGVNGAVTIQNDIGLGGWVVIG